MDNRVSFYEDQAFHEREWSIFLAGPSKRGGSFEGSWRQQAVTFLRDAGFKGRIYVPESIGGVYQESEVPYEETTKWEWARLDLSDVILFWIPRNEKTLPGFTTNVEFGRYVEKRPRNVVMGHPKEAVRMEYLDLLYREKCGRSIPNSLRETCMEAAKRVSLLRRIENTMLELNTDYER